MERYQVRLHDKSIEKLCDEVVEGVWPEVVPLVAGREVKAHKAVVAALREVFSKNLHRLDVCGTAAFCDECCGRPLMPEAEASENEELAVDEDTERYLLFVAESLERFLQETTSVIWLHLVGKEAVRELQPSPSERGRITEALRRSLAPYVYFNAECGHRRQCADQSLPGK